MKESNQGDPDGLARTARGGGGGGLHHRCPDFSISEAAFLAGIENPPSTSVLAAVWAQMGRNLPDSLKCETSWWLHRDQEPQGGVGRPRASVSSGALAELTRGHGHNQEEAGDNRKGHWEDQRGIKWEHLPRAASTDAGGQVCPHQVQVCVCVCPGEQEWG